MDNKSSKRESNRIDLSLQGQGAQHDKLANRSAQVISKNQKTRKEKTSTSSNQTKQFEDVPTPLHQLTPEYVIDFWSNDPEYKELVDLLKGYVDKRYQEGAPPEYNEAKTLRSDEGMGLPPINQNLLKENYDEHSLRPLRSTRTPPEDNEAKTLRSDECMCLPPINLQLPKENDDEHSLQPLQSTSDYPKCLQSEEIKNKLESQIMKLQSLLSELKTSFKEFQDSLKARVKEIQADVKHGVRTSTDDDKNQDIIEDLEGIKQRYTEFWNKINEFFNDVHQFLYDDMKMQAGQKQFFSNPQSSQAQIKIKLPEVKQKGNQQLTGRDKPEHMRQKGGMTGTSKYVRQSTDKEGVEEQSQRSMYRQISSWGNQPSNIYHEN